MKLSEAIARLEEMNCKPQKFYNLALDIIEKQDAIIYNISKSYSLLIEAFGEQKYDDVVRHSKAMVDYLNPDIKLTPPKDAL